MHACSPKPGERRARCCVSLRGICPTLIGEWRWDCPRESPLLKTSRVYFFTGDEARLEFTGLNGGGCDQACTIGQTQPLFNEPSALGNSALIIQGSSALFIRVRIKAERLAR